jgi:cellobiose phosphorylase
VGSHQIRLTLAPGEARSFIFVLGYCENPQAEKFSAPGVINKAPAHALLSRLQDRRAGRRGARGAEEILG